MTRRFLAYCLRWQCSTPILWAVIALLGPGLVPTVVANAVGAATFYAIDRRILRG